MFSIPTHHILNTMCRRQVTEALGFAADHYHSLPGFTEPRHGHIWRVEATAGGGDRERLAEALGVWVATVDGMLLNDVDLLNGRNPTAETVAECAFLFLMEAGIRPLMVKVWEKPHCWAACIQETE